MQEIKNSITSSLIINLSLLLVISLIVYILIYKYFKIPLSVKSYMLFFCNVFIFFCFILSICRLPTLSLEKPLQINDLTTLTVYKYILLILVSFTGLSIYLLYKVLKFKYPTVNIFNLREEFVRLFEKLSISDTFYESLTNNLEKTNNIKKYLCVNFVLIYLPTVLQTILLINFVFFSGDLRLNIYLIPLSFTSWILKDLEYFFKNKVDKDLFYLSKLLEVSYLKDTNNMSKGYIRGTKEDFTFNLTEFGVAEGYTVDAQSLKILSEMWIHYNNIHCYLNIYENNLLYYIKTFNFICRLLCWNVIVYYYYFHITNKNTSFFSIFLVISGSFRRISTPNLVRGYASEAWTIRRRFQKKLEAETEGAYKPGHMAKVDVEIKNDKGYVLFEGGSTHGAGSKENPSYKEHSTKDLSGQPNPKGQSTTPAKSETYIDPNYLNQRVPNSKEFFETSESRVNTATNTHTNWEEKNT